MSNDITALIAKLREYIPNGDGHDSEFAHTLQSAIEALSSRPEVEAVANVMWGSSDEADFEKGTWTFSMEPGFRVGAGRYAIVFERDFFSAPPAAAEGVPADSVALAACRAVVEWCDKNPPAGSALWCVNLCRFAIAKAPAFSPVAEYEDALRGWQAEFEYVESGNRILKDRVRELESELARLRSTAEPSLVMVGAQAGAVPAREYTDGRWHHGNGNLCMGTLRVARADFDTNPPKEFQTAFFEEMCAVLNTKTTAAPIVDANKGGVPEGWAVREGISAGTYTLVHPSGIKFTFGHDGSMYAGAVADFLKAMLSAAPSAPVAADEKSKGMTVYEIGQLACGSLPEGWTINIHLENGCGYAVLNGHGDEGPEFNGFDLADEEAGLDEQVVALVEKAIEYEASTAQHVAALAARKAAGNGGEA